MAYPILDQPEVLRAKRLVLIPGADRNDLVMVGMSQYFEAIQLVN